MDKLQVVIDHNYTRLLNRYILQLIPEKHGRIHKEGIYNCVAGNYGRMGQLRCVNFFRVELINVNINMIRLADADQHYMANMRSKGLQANDMIQCCTFEFVKRYDQPFNDMLKRELKIMGLQMPQPADLFTPQS